MSALLDRVFVARGEWAHQHGGQWPARVYLGSKAVARVLRATCGISAAIPELIEHGEHAGALYTVKRFATDVLQMEWFEDTRLPDEAFRFE